MQFHPSGHQLAVGDRSGNLRYESISHYVVVTDASKCSLVDVECVLFLKHPLVLLSMVLSMMHVGLSGLGPSQMWSGAQSNVVWASRMWSGAQWYQETWEHVS